MPVTFQSIKDTQDELIKYAVIAARYNNKWVFCRHRERSTWEIPGGHREPGEAIIDTARRALYEETGALSSEIKPVCISRKRLRSFVLCRDNTAWLTAGEL